jgi:hypothetical protein
MKAGKSSMRCGVIDGRRLSVALLLGVVAGLSLCASSSAEGNGEDPLTQYNRNVETSAGPGSLRIQGEKNGIAAELNVLGPSTRWTSGPEPPAQDAEQQPGGHLGGGRAPRLINPLPNLPSFQMLTPQLLTLCAGQQCETRPNGVQVIPGFGIPGYSFTVDTPTVPTTNWRPAGPATIVNLSGAVANLKQRVPFPSLRLRTNPTQGVVALPSWYWVEGWDGSELRDSGAAETVQRVCRQVIDAITGESSQECSNRIGSVSLELRAVPSKYVWEFGDGTGDTFKTKDGLGRAYTDPQTPSWVTHSYEVSSLGIPDGFPITLDITFTTVYSIDGGGWNDSGEVQHTYAGNHLVRQIERLRVPTQPLR